MYHSNTPFKIAFLIGVLSLFMVACRNPQSSIETTEAGDTLTLQYATNISIIHYPDYTKVELANPWRKGSILHTYILINDTVSTAHLPEGTVVRIPLTHSVVYSGVHGSIIDELGAHESIKAVCEIEYFTNANILKAYEEGRIVNLGNSLAPNIEALIDLSPDAILLSPFENSGGYGLVETLDIPIIECADYMETSSLGRAEWMKFYGLLYGKGKEAEALFQQVAAAYNELKEIAQTATAGPKVICDLITGSTWYVPGGNSTIGKLIADAGGDYVFHERMESGSLALSPETVFSESQHADVWFMKYTQATDKTYDDLAADSPLYQQMKAFQHQNVFGCNLSYTHFYNDLPYHPERHLKDMIKMFHPELLPRHQLKYYKPLQP